MSPSGPFCGSGLWKLNPDGTQTLDEHGAPITTYTNDDIVTFSRAWTGHTRQNARRNIENPDGNSNGGRNNLDPMWIVPEWRDPFPILDLHGGYVGDGYPLCVEMPSQSFLREGARFSYVGGAVSSYMQQSYSAAALTLDDTTSPLYEALCSGGSAATGGGCVLRSEVVLQTNLSSRCVGGAAWKECLVDTARLVKLHVGNWTAYYEWRRPACVEMPFYPDAKVVTLTNSGTRDTCADPRMAVAGSCCVIGGSSRGLCEHTRERMTYATARARCDAALGSVCADNSERVTNAECDYKSQYIRHWTSSPCSVKAQVDRAGWVSIVHVPFGKVVNRRPSFAADNENIFRVAWRDGLFPSTDGNCSATCEVRGDTCLCDVDVKETRIFDSLPTAAQVTASCKIGSFCPRSYDASTYVLVGQSGEVEAYANAGKLQSGGGFNEETVFVLQATGACYANRLSLVHVEGTKLTFRNRCVRPPSERITARCTPLRTHGRVCPYAPHRNEDTPHTFSSTLVTLRAS